MQYTIRGIPPELDKQLRRIAAQRKQSLNQVVVDDLAGAVMGHKHRADLSDLVGKWTLDPAFDEVFAAQRQIDLGKWR